MALVPELRENDRMRPAFCFLLAATLSFGQSGSQQGYSQTFTDQRVQRWVLNQMENRDVVADQLSASRQAAYQEEEFRRRANRVVELWSEVVADHQDKRVDAKKMRELSKAFHELEKSDGWLKMK
jgi:hypothetical protein